jgi:hypothetical protein
MQLTLTPAEAAFIYRMIINPYQFPLNAIKVGGQSLLPWRPKGEGKDARLVAKQLAALKKWFNLHVATEVTEKDGNIAHKLPTEDIQVGLTQTYVDFLKKVLMEYYEPVGLLTENVDTYLQLYEKLNGEKYEVDDPFVPMEKELK